MAQGLTALFVFEQSNGEVTTSYYKRLETFGALGVVALNLFRAQKCSTRAKLYRGRKFKGNAYDRKSWSMGLLCETLQKNGAELGITYGWKTDPETLFGSEESWVLYVDLPNGQVSFHSPARGSGPDYAGEWDRARLSTERILAFCDAVEHPGSFPAP